MDFTAFFCILVCRICKSDSVALIVHIATAIIIHIHIMGAVVMNASTAKNKDGLKIILSILGIYAICLAFRCIEYFLIRTDQTFFGEAFIHKLLGIAVCFAALRVLHIKPREIGFHKRSAPKNMLYGAILGVSVYFVAYAVETIILAAMRKSPQLQLYVTSYSVDGNIGNQTGFVFFVLCVVCNIINVIMEEIVFR